VNNLWVPLTEDEVREFTDKYTEIGKYISKPELIEEMKYDVPPNVTLYESWDRAAKRIMNNLWKQNGA